MKRKQLNYKAAVAASAIGAIFALKGCNSPEKKSNPRPMPSTPLISKPARDDGSCEVEKGEADPRSPTFDPEGCGYCGDGEKQYHESIDNCPVDFHCGNSVLDKKETYAKWNVDGNAFSLGVTEITEECDPSSPVPSCESNQVCRNNCTCGSNLNVCSSAAVAAASKILANIHGKLKSSIDSLAIASGVKPGQSFSVVVTLRLDSSGEITFMHATTRCDRGECPREINVLDMASINFDGMRIDPGQFPTYQPCMLLLHSQKWY